MMNHYDTIVIGGGILGCFAARNLRKWDISTLLIEKAEDICTGITRANSAIVYAGYDNKPHTIKTHMTLRGNQAFDRLCHGLDVPFSTCGSLMVSFGPKGDRSLIKKLKQGQENGVPGLRLLTGKEACTMESTLSQEVSTALYSPTTGTVNPWQLGIAAYENAIDNGCETLLNTTVLNIQRETNRYRVDTNRGSLYCQSILNCAGLNAVHIQQMIYPTSISLRLDGSDYLVLDKQATAPHRIIFHEAEDGKGITAIPCVEGNLLINAPARPLGTHFATTRQGLEFIAQTVDKILPGVSIGQVIRSFGAVRPNPERTDEGSIHDFCIEQPAEDFISLMGIKTPGLTCANELGEHLAKKIAVYLNAPPNLLFNPYRTAIRQSDYNIICQCEHITRSEVIEAIRRGATTVMGVKHRVGTGMGRCQGSRCSYRIEQLLEEARHGRL